MDYLINFCEEFNCYTYNRQCKFIKNKLLSLDLNDMQYIMFFKKLHVLFNDLPSHIKKISRDNRRYIYNFDSVLVGNNSYFNETRGYIHIDYTKLSNNIYFIKIPIENNKLCVHTHIDINLV